MVRLKSRGPNESGELKRRAWGVSPMISSMIFSSHNHGAYAAPRSPFEYSLGFARITRGGFSFSIWQSGFDVVSNIFGQPGSGEELAERLSQNTRGEKRSLVPVGGGTWLDFGGEVSSAEELSTRGLTKVLDYPARDMTITVEAGLPFAQLLETLKAEGQQVPVDVPQPELATVGGVIAANGFGPRRYGLGTLRDFVIGLTAVDANGRLFHAGGRVVKNVAGYDLCKLMVGSWGTLAVLTQITFKVAPLPQSQSWIWSTWNAVNPVDTVLTELLHSETRPLALEVLNPAAANFLAKSLDQNLPADSYVLAALVAGSKADTTWQTEQWIQEITPRKPNACEVITGTNAEALLASLTNFPIAKSGFCFRAHLRPSRMMELVHHATQAGFLIQSHAGNGIVIGHAAEDWGSIETHKGALNRTAQVHGIHWREFDPLGLPRRLETGTRCVWKPAFLLALDETPQANPGPGKFAQPRSLVSR